MVEMKFEDRKYILDEYDKQILKVLSDNARTTMSDLGEIIGKSRAAVYQRIKVMEEAGIICGYHTMIDWDKTDIDKVTALIEVRVTPQRGKGFDDIAESIYKYPEVNSVYLISGGYDLLVTLEGKSLKEVSRFVSSKLSTLDTVISTATHFILKKYKDHGTIMTRKYEDQREMITP
jgi:DNA-binding Lrp family transcriptional regulator